MSLANFRTGQRDVSVHVPGWTTGSSASSIAPLLCIHTVYTIQLSAHDVYNI